LADIDIIGVKMPVKTSKEDLAKKMLVDRTEYLTSGVHIGMKTCTKYMKQFVYKIRDDGLAVFNIQRVDERIKLAAEFLSKFDNVLAVSRKGNGIVPIKKFTEFVDGKACFPFPSGYGEVLKGRGTNFCK